MTTKECATHHGTPARGHCLQCHRPYCDLDMFRGPEGEFCSQGCAQKYAAFQERYRKIGAPERAGGSIIIGLLLLAALLLGVAWAGHSFLHIEALAKFDVIGKMLR